MNRSLLFIGLLALCFGFLSCQTQSSSENQEKESIKIVCTTGMLADAVHNIVGEEAQVIGLMGPGVDPHLYKATQGDLKELSNADIIIYNGLHLEGKMGEIFEKLENRKRIIVAADGVKKSELIQSADFQGAFDPHLWFDVALWAEVVEHLGIEISTVEGFNKDAILKNTLSYSNKLKELDLWVSEEIAKIDSSKRVMITAHDAFGYFGRAYNIEVRGLQGISTLSEYGLKDVSDLVSYITDKKIQAVFVESSVSDRSLKAVVEGCEKRGHTIDIGGTLYSDAMGQEGTAEGEYIGMVNYNVNTIVKALK